MVTKKGKWEAKKDDFGKFFKLENLQNISIQH